MNPVLGFMIESLVAMLLLLTIGYCMLLNKRLQRLKADEHSLKAVIGELVTATEIAERAIGGLKHTVRDVNEHLGTQLGAANEMSEHLRKQLAEADHVVRRLSKIAFAARSPIDEPAAAPAPTPAPPPAAAAPAPRAPAIPASAAPAASAPVPAPASAPASPARISNAKAVAAAAQAFSERRRSGGLAA